MSGGDLNYNYEISSDERDTVTAIVISTQRMVKDLMLCRERMVETLKRQGLIEEKTFLFRKQCDSVKNECSRLRRTIVLIKANPAVLGVNIDPANEIAELEKSLASKEETYQELRILAKVLIKLLY